MAVKFTNNAATTLAAGINSSATSISVTDGSVFPSLSSGEHFYVTFDDTTNTEIVKVTARSSNTLTVVRGQDNTTARAFSSGDKAELRVVAALLEDVKTEVTSTLSVDTFTGDDSATAFTLSQAPSSEDNLIVFIEGVYQNPGDFTLSGTTLTLDTAPLVGRKIVAYHVSGAVSGNNLNHDQFTANGSTAAFTLSIAPIHENNTQVFIDGVYQQKDSYSVSGTTLTLDANPANGAKVEVMTFTQTDVNTIPASFVAGLTEVSAVGADHLLVYDATDNALKKALASDLIETVGATPTFTTANITNTTTGDSLLFTTTEDSSTAAPVITLKRNSSSPADADYLGQLKFKGENDADQEVVYAKITSKIQDASDGSEDGLLEFANIKAGSQTITARLKSDKLQLLNSTGLEVAGDLTVDTNTLYVDSTNNKVGINNTSPNSYLSSASNLVVGTGSGDNGMTIASGASDKTRFCFADGTSGGAPYDGFIMYDHSAQNMQFGTASTGATDAYINSKGIFYGAENGVVYDGLVGHYEMLEAASYSGSGSTWTNLAGSSNNGTFYNYTYDYKDHMRGTDGNYLQVKWDNPLNNTSSNTVCVLLATNDATSVTFGNGAAGSNYIGAWEDSGTQNYYHGNAGTVTSYINGEQTTAWTNRRERGALKWHWIEFKNVDFTASGWSELWFNKYAGSYQMANFNTCIGAVLFYNKNLSDAERQQNLMFMRRRYGEHPDFRTQIVYPTLTSPWSNYGGSYESVHYFRDTHGFVHINGLASANGTTTSNTLFTLPIGFRPKGSLILDSSRSGAEGGMSWQIYASGEVSPRVSQSSWASVGFSFLANGT